MEEIAIMNARIIESGEHDRIDCSGNTKINGEINCKEFESTGKTYVNGNINCEGKMTCSGSFECKGIIITDEASFSDRTYLKDSLKANTLGVTGHFKSEKDVFGESVSIDGAFDIEGQIRAGELKIVLSDGESHADIMVCENVAIKSKSSSLQSTASGKVISGDSLTVNYIEGDEINVEGVNVDHIRGKIIRIGKNCLVKQVEYGISVDIDKTSVVDEKIQEFC